MSRRKGKGTPRPLAARVRAQKKTAPVSPAKPGLYCPTDVSPETLFREIGRLRKEARDRGPG
jgi:hypothetical protein